MNSTPLNEEALGRMFATAMMEVLDAEKLQPGNRLVHVNDIQEVLNRLEKNILSAVPAADKRSEEVARMRDMVAEAISNPGESVHEFVSLPDLYQLLDHLVTVPADTVNSFDPRELNRRGWTCGCEPGNYDTCDECQWVCNELAGFLNRPAVGS